MGARALRGAPELRREITALGAGGGRDQGSSGAGNGLWEVSAGVSRGSSGASTEGRPRAKEKGQDQNQRRNTQPATEGLWVPWERGGLSRGNREAEKEAWEAGGEPCVHTVGSAGDSPFKVALSH